MTAAKHEPWFTLTYPLVAGIWWNLPKRWKKARPAGFNPEVNAQRLVSIRFRASRNWKAWHVHDVRFLLNLLDEAQCEVNALRRTLNVYEGQE
jgi:hypothetical protein